MLVLLGISMLIPCILGGISVGSLWLAHDRAASAADLGALAGATALTAGTDPCGAVGRIVSVNHASVRSCAVVGTTVEVEAEITVPEAFGLRVTVSASSRAGPAGAPQIRDTLRG